MAHHGKILIIDDDHAVLQSLQRILTRGGWEVETAPDGEAGLVGARKFIPDLILCDYGLPGINGFELCQRIKGDPTTALAMFVILTGYDDTRLKVAGLRLGVDEYLEKTHFDAPELLAKAHALLRIKRLHDDLRKEKQALEQMRELLTGSFEQLLSVLLYVLDLRVPGASARAERLTTWAFRIAERFSIPEAFLEEFRLATLLHEIGRLTEPSRITTPASANGGPTPHDWAYVVASKSIMERVERLQGAATIVSAIYENWDGTGLPNRWCKGQIPLRSRILRVLIDFFGIVATANRNGGTAGSLNTLSGHAGTWYDPVVINHLSAVMESDPELLLVDTSHRVVVDDLEDGMVLAKDLHSASGVKLLAAGLRITPGILDLVQRRSLADPIISGVWVHS